MKYQNGLAKRAALLVVFILTYSCIPQEIHASLFSFKQSSSQSNSNKVTTSGKNGQDYHLTPDQKAYFDQLFKETWACLSELFEPQTGIPYDSTAKQPVTSTSNVGLYLASVAVAYKTGLISKEEGLKKIQTAFESLDKVRKWRGFPRPWFRVKNLEPAFGNEFSYGSHTANLLGGLTLAKIIFPELEGKIEAFLAGMSYKDLYDKDTGWLKGGYNMSQNNFAVFQSWGRWYYKFFASDTRLLSFYGIARDAFPLDHWKALVRTEWRKDGYSLLTSGYEEGGLFTYYMSGLFLDERKLMMGKYQRDYASVQMKHAEKIGAPVWGWSSCETPKGKYLGYGELRDEIVAPYASILAVIYFPQDVYKNLQALERLGARKPFLMNGKEFLWGFHDSINWHDNTLAKNALVPNQAMIFLSLANFLHHGIVWTTFETDTHVQKGLAKIRTLESS